MRLGQFNVSGEFVHGLRSGEGANLMRDILVIDVRREFCTDTVSYLAYSDQFEETRHGEVPPIYIPVFSQDSPFPKWVKEV